MPNTKYAHIHSWAMTAEGEHIGEGDFNIIGLTDYMQRYSSTLKMPS